VVVRADVLLLSDSYLYMLRFIVIFIFTHAYIAGKSHRQRKSLSRREIFMCVGQLSALVLMFTYWSLLILN